MECNGHKDDHWLSLSGTTFRSRELRNNVNSGIVCEAKKGRSFINFDTIQNQAVTGRTCRGRGSRTSAPKATDPEGWQRWSGSLGFNSRLSASPPLLDTDTRCGSRCSGAVRSQSQRCRRRSWSLSVPSIPNRGSLFLI
jgi:hypothetical protein